LSAVASTDSVCKHPTTDVFTQHYEFHYRNNKIQLEGSESTFAAQFGCITFHPMRFRSRSRLTPTVRNKWTGRWDGNWFYCRVPLEQTTNVRGKGNYLLSCTMTLLNYVTEVTFECGPGDVNVVAFHRGCFQHWGSGCCRRVPCLWVWPLSDKLGFTVEMKETPLSKVLVSMPQVCPAISAQ
jgi:hypothetical protein